MCLWYFGQSSEFCSGSECCDVTGNMIGGMEESKECDP